jgi:DNA-binding NarL/FixJ family response regulator
MIASKRPPLSVMVAHRLPPMRAHLRSIVHEAPGFCMAAEADTAAGAVDLFFRFSPDVALIDVRLPDRSGFEVAQCIRQARPGCFIILMTAASDPFVDEVGRMLGVAAICDHSSELGRVREVLDYLLARRA